MKKHAQDLGKRPVVVIVTDFTSTTWRMFVPVISGLLLGAQTDKMLHSKPWALIGGIIIGSVIAVLLVRRQFKNL